MPSNRMFERGRAIKPRAGQRNVERPLSGNSTVRYGSEAVVAKRRLTAISGQ
jgi:hypothetical protein